MGIPGDFGCNFACFTQTFVFYRVSLEKLIRLFPDNEQARINITNNYIFTIKIWIYTPCTIECFNFLTFFSCMIARITPSWCCQFDSVVIMIINVGVKKSFFCKTFLFNINYIYNTPISKQTPTTKHIMRFKTT